MSDKFKVGDMAYLDNRRSTRALILSTPTGVHRRYPVLLESGNVGYYIEQTLMTLPEWLKWWDGFQDELIPKEWQECAENAKRQFVPPPGWDEAVNRAMKPYMSSRDNHVTLLPQKSPSSAAACWQKGTAWPRNSKTSA
jgi:hypothetical protein